MPNKKFMIEGEIMMAAANKNVTAKPTVAKETAIVKPNLAITVKLYGVEASEIFLIGNVAALGAWNDSKAKKLTKKGDSFVTTINTQLGEMIEFKIANAASWNNVEKGMFGEELANHAVLIDTEKMEIEIGVSNFAK